MPEEQKTIRKLRAILSADVKGYSLLMADDEAYTIKKLEAYRDSMSDLIRSHSGRVVDAVGDNLLAEFSSVVDAVRCSVEIQKDLQQKNADLPTDKCLKFRIGVNIGDVIQEGDRIYGNGVNVAARIEGLAESGGICISRNTYNHVRDKLELGYEYLGEHSVKNIKRPVRVYKVLMDPEDAGKLIGVKTKPSAKKWVWPLVAAVVILLGIVAWQVYEKLTTPDFKPATVENMVFPLPEKPSIAVLPFDNMSGDPEQEFFSDGITEEIITALSKTPKMFVIARNSTFTYKGKAVKVQQVAEELGVRYVLEGSVRKSEGQVRITAQLIDALTGEHMWAERYDREFKDIFALQDEVTKEILTALHIKLTDGEQARIYAKGTDNLEAYLKAMQAQWYAYLWTKRGNSEAKRLIEEAIALAPDYAYAHRVLGTTHIVDLFVGSSNSPKESLAKAAGAYRKAITLDESLASAYGAMGFVLTMMRKYDEAIRLGKKAVALEPNSADVINMYATILTYAGMVDEAIPMHRTALRLNPKPPITYYQPFGHALRISGQYEEAIAMQKKAIEQEPDNYNAFIILAASASLAGYDQEARAAVKEILRIDPQFSVKRLIAPFKDRTILRKNCDALNNAGLSLNCDVFPAEEPSIVKSDKPSIAVLPFVNMSNDPEQEYFSDGMTDELIGDLAKINDIFVISRNSAFTYKGKSIKAQQIANDLNVRYILEGSVQRSGNKVRIRAQLIDGKTDHHLWSESYDGLLDDIFELQDKITGNIVSALAVKLTPDERIRISDKGTENILAYETFLKGFEHYSRFTAKNLLKAIEFYQQAIVIDPNFSRAYSGLAVTYFMLQTNDFLRELSITSQIDIMNLRIKARHYLDIAMKNPTWETYRVASLMDRLRRQFDSSKAFAQKAVFLAPNESLANLTLGGSFIWSGRAEKALYYIDKAMKLDPELLDIKLGEKGQAYFVLGEYEKAVEFIQRCLTLNSSLLMYRGFLAASYSFLGQKKEAENAWELFKGGFPKGFPPTTQSLYYLQPFKDHQIFDRLIEGLKMAGFEGNPLDYYKVEKQNKLSGQEIKNLIMGKAMNYYQLGWIWSRSENGNLESPNPSGGFPLKGKSWIEADAICDQYDLLFDGIKYCADIYRISESDEDADNEYLFLADFNLFPVSIELY